MKHKVKKFLKQKRLNLASQVITILIILTVPVFIFATQQQIQTQQFAAGNVCQAAGTTCPLTCTASTPYCLVPIQGNCTGGIQNYNVYTCNGKTFNTTPKVQNGSQGVCTATDKCAATTTVATCGTCANLACGKANPYCGVPRSGSTCDSTKPEILDIFQCSGTTFPAKASYTQKFDPAIKCPQLSSGNTCCYSQKVNGGTACFEGTGDNGFNPPNGCHYNQAQPLPVACPGQNSSSSSSSSSTSSSNSSSSSSSSNNSSSSSSSSTKATVNITVITNPCTAAKTTKQSCTIGFKNNDTVDATWVNAGFSNNINNADIQNNGTGSVTAGHTANQSFVADCSSASTADISFNFTPAPAGGPNPVKITVQCGDGTMQATLSFLGLSNTPKHTSRNFNFLFTPYPNLSGAKPISIPGTATYDPATKLYKANTSLKVPPGKYQISIHSNGSLDTQVLQPDGTSVFTLPTLLTPQLITIIQGDIAPNTQGDNFIDIIDYNRLIGCFGNPPTGACQTSDINDDGVIDEKDLDLLLQHFGELGFSLSTPQFSCAIDPKCNSGQTTLQMCQLICTKQPSN